ncbi:uncharacterized protein LOC110453777 isoform X2 [Mizuhopecten yessoensis]|uniref:uncharacterized protein LOC110453777 isoform X2 n=1 Tax=Mizuhopecten yessoensis TaxID=6573 RepID=UPI000B45D80E|nr:uncharacterized protein LOC110453777 isoform X2 [Mizuhopecten yessoensis]
MGFFRNITKMLPSVFRYLYLIKRRCTKSCLVLFMLIVVACMVYGYITYMKTPEYVFIHKDIHSECILPDIDINDPTINKYYSWHPQPLECDPTPSLTLVDKSGYLRFNDSIYKPSQNATLKCVYSTINLVTDFKVNFETEIAFSGPVDVPADCFIVRCRNPSGKVVYENLHQKIDRKSKEKTRVIKEETDEDLSVFMFGIDSVSRLGAIRKLPKTVKYLTETLGGHVLKGYNKVGDNTFPNLVPLLCGKSVEQSKVDYQKAFSDSYPFIWYEFEKQGYVTMHSEDWPEIATFDHSVPAGFSKPPTTHYSRPLWLAMRKIQPMQYMIDQVFMFFESKAMKMKTSSGMCYGNRPNHMLVVDYFKKFVHAYKGKRKFAFAWLNELAHNYVNFLEYGDNDFMELLKWLHMEGHMNKSVLVFYSDHGSRQDEIRNTYVGRIEDRMPFISIVLPEVLKKRYPEIVENLKANEKKLTTVFNIHEALRDVLHKRYGGRASDVRGNDLAPQSISIFKRLPETQSCADAKIPETYCACYASHPIDKSAPIVKTIANFLLQSINEILLPVRDKCAKLSLYTIIEARSIENSLERKVDKETKFTLLSWILTPEQKNDQTYLIVIRTVPGNATFESTVRQTDKGVLKILGDVSRTNPYGTQSACMHKRYKKDIKTHLFTVAY